MSVVRYGATTALDIAALEVKKGEVLAILGANGAGKSTLLRVMGLLQPADQGTVEFPGLAAITGIRWRCGGASPRCFSNRF